MAMENTVLSWTVSRPKKNSSAPSEAAKYPTRMGQTLPGWLPEKQQASIQKTQPSVTAFHVAPIRL